MPSAATWDAETHAPAFLTAPSEAPAIKGVTESDNTWFQHAFLGAVSAWSDFALSDPESPTLELNSLPGTPKSSPWEFYREQSLSLSPREVDLKGAFFPV